MIGTICQHCNTVRGDGLYTKYPPTKEKTNDTDRNRDPEPETVTMRSGRKKRCGEGRD